jgi:hypothetical protein
LQSALTAPTPTSFCPNTPRAARRP